MGTTLGTAETERDTAQPLAHAIGEMRTETDTNASKFYFNWLQAGCTTGGLARLWSLTHPSAFRKKKRLKEGSF